jgi:hypothetical protein
MRARESREFVARSRRDSGSFLVIGWGATAAPSYRKGGLAVSIPRSHTILGLENSYVEERSRFTRRSHSQRPTSFSTFVAIASLKGFERVTWKRLARAIKDRTGRHRSLLKTAASAMEHFATCVPGLLVATGRTPKALRPRRPDAVRAALFGSKPKPRNQNPQASEGGRPRPPDVLPRACCGGYGNLREVDTPLSAGMKSATSAVARSRWPGATRSWSSIWIARTGRSKSPANT